MAQLVPALEADQVANAMISRSRSASASPDSSSPYISFSRPIASERTAAARSLSSGCSCRPMSLSALWAELDKIPVADRRNVDVDDARLADIEVEIEEGGLQGRRYFSGPRRVAPSIRRRSFAAWLVQPPASLAYRLPNARPNAALRNIERSMQGSTVRSRLTRRTLKTTTATKFDLATCSQGSAFFLQSLAALSRLKHGFASRRERQRFQ
jgi:hypothetical protein